MPTGGRGAYGITKAAVSHMTKVMAAELAPDNIRVVAYMPGFVLTGINAAVLGEHGAALVLPEEGLDGKRLFTEAAALLRDETRLAAMHEASLRLGVRDATERIYETVMALVK